MKTMKTCKVGCGKMKAGGPIKKVKKMANGGQALNKAHGYADAQSGGDNVKMGIYGIPNAGPTGNNRTAGYSYKNGGSAKMKKGGFPDLNKDGKVSRADVLKGRGVFKKGGVKKYQDGGSSEENPSGKSIGKQAAVFGGALAALVAATREKGIERRAQKAQERYDKRQVKKQAKLEAKNTPKSRMGGMTKSKKK